MGDARLDITVPMRLESDEERATRIAEARATVASCGRDAALESARNAAAMLSDVSELLYSADKCRPTIYSRAAAVKLQAARNAVDQCIADYSREPSRERLGPPIDTDRLAASYKPKGG